MHYCKLHQFPVLTLATSDAKKAFKCLQGACFSKTVREKKMGNWDQREGEIPFLT